MKKILNHTVKKSDAEKLADQLTNPSFDIITKIADKTIGVNGLTEKLKVHEK